MIPSHQVTFFGQIFSIMKKNFIFADTYRCVKGQGMINMRTHDTGDLIVQFDVEFPAEKSLNETQLKVILQYCNYLLLSFLFSISAT